MITPIKTVLVRDVEFYVVSETYTPIEPQYYDGMPMRMLIPTVCSRPDPFGDFSRCSLGTYNVLYQYVDPEEPGLEGFTDFNDEQVAGHFETETEFSEFGFTDEEVEEFIETLLEH